MSGTRRGRTTVQRLRQQDRTAKRSAHDGGRRLVFTRPPALDWPVRCPCGWRGTIEQLDRSGAPSCPFCGDTHLGSGHGH